ncbi:MAG TPA: anti-sigma F factor antagonist [Acetivibrio sp.]|nr:anti-sigma F factor antagonist [Acetivibrio sp.]
MNLKLTNRGTTLIAAITGELDHHSAEHIIQKLDAEIMKSTTKNLIMDFSKVNFMDSSGIGVVIGRYKKIQRLNGKLFITGINDKISRIFNISGLLKLVPACENIDDAINKM